MAPRGRSRKKVAGNTRMDAALDATRQYGFEEKLVRETVEELLDVYEGTQGWPFIEEVSYKLLIETMLSKPQSSEQDKDNAGRGDEVAETSTTTTFTTGITEVGSSSLVNHDPLLLHSSQDMNHNSASQTIDQYPPSLCNHQATDVKDSTGPAEGGGGGGGCEQGIRVESQSKLKPMDIVNGSNHTTKFVSNVDQTTFAKNTMIESPEGIGNLPRLRRNPYYGWIDDDNDNKVELMCFPIPPLPEHIEKLIGQSVVAPGSGRRRQRRKSRWDEKPDVCVRDQFFVHKTDIDGGWAHSP